MTGAASRTTMNATDTDGEAQRAYREIGPLDNVEKIAVLAPGAVGDFVFALPALHVLKHTYPDAELVYLGKAWHEGFLTHRPGPVDRVLVLPPVPGVGLAGDAPADAGAADTAVECLRQERFDIALQMFGGGRYSNPFLLRLGARLSVGARAADAVALDRWVTHAVPGNRRLALLEIAALAGARGPLPERELDVTDADRREVARVLALHSPQAQAFPRVSLRSNVWTSQQASLGTAPHASVETAPQASLETAPHASVETAPQTSLETAHASLETAPQASRGALKCSPVRTSRKGSLHAPLPPPVVPSDEPLLVVLQPGSTDARRCWGAERFAAVGDVLAASGALIAINGTADEAERVGRVRSAMRHPSIDLSGALTLGGLCGLIERAALVVSNDTGPLHLALAIGTPCVGIFWHTNLADGMPLRPSLLRAAVSCRQRCPVCGADNRLQRCPHDESFVDDVPADEVAMLALSMLHPVR